MFLCLGAGGGALWRPWYDSGRHGSSCFYDEQACLLCFVCVLYGKLLPREKMRHVSFFVAGSRKHPTTAGAVVESEGSIQQQCWAGAFDGGGVGQRSGS
jgi:hypothetical protein